MYSEYSLSEVRMHVAGRAMVSTASQYDAQQVLYGAGVCD